MRLTSSSRRQSASLRSAKALSGAGMPVWAIPAAFTRMSSRPCSRSTVSTSAKASARTVRSATWAEAVAPAARSSSARPSTRAVVAVSATAAPSRASSRAQAWPMPDSLPQPVTSATRLVKSKGRSSKVLPILRAGI